MKPKTTTSSGKVALTLPMDAQILITREFTAPKRLVCKVWTTPLVGEALVAAKRGRVTTADIDLRVGGTRRWVMVTDDGVEVTLHGEYRETTRTRTS